MESPSRAAFFLAGNRRKGSNPRHRIAGGLFIVFWFKQMARQALDLLYPRVCAGCGGPVGAEEHHVCWNCSADMPYVRSPFCARCGDPVDGRVDHSFVCYSCSDREPWFDLARSAVRFRELPQKLIRALKYDAALWYRMDLAHWLRSCWESQFREVEVDAVACVPLHATRVRERGYNQARVLGVLLARRLGKPFIPGCLQRIRMTPTQTHLTAPQRAANVRGAFKAKNPVWVSGLRIVLVDDVMTTGATVNECARALKEAGAARVYVVTVARG